MGFLQQRFRSIQACSSGLSHSNLIPPTRKCGGRSSGATLDLVWSRTQDSVVPRRFASSAGLIFSYSGIVATAASLQGFLLSLMCAVSRRRAHLHRCRTSPARCSILSGHVLDSEQAGNTWLVLVPRPTPPRACYAFELSPAESIGGRPNPPLPGAAKS